MTGQAPHVDLFLSKSRVLVFIQNLIYSSFTHKLKKQIKPNLVTFVGLLLTSFQEHWISACILNLLILFFSLVVSVFLHHDCIMVLYRVKEV